ncbi:MAG: HK97 gp10 family phage protein [Erysipelotrichaceae bacterium]
MVDNDEFVKSIDNATLELINETIRNVDKACLVVARDAKVFCPVDQGQLRASIATSVDSNTREIVGSVFSALDYAPYIEMGTGIYASDGKGRKTPWSWGNKGSKKWPGRRGFKGSRPHPFLEPAKLNNKGKIEKILGGKQ